MKIGNKNLGFISKNKTNHKNLSYKRDPFTKRIFGLLGVVAFLFAALILRLSYVQTIASSRYAAYGRSESVSTKIVAPSRASVLDRNGHVLQMSIPQTTVYADPKLVTNPASEASALAPYLGFSKSAIQGVLSQKKLVFAYLARTIPNSAAQKVKALHLPGIYFLSQPKTFSPQNLMASPVLGSVGISNNGLSGLEYQYNKLLSGTPGVYSEQVTPFNSGAIPGTVHLIKKGVPGHSLVLTIDRSVQYETEKILSQQVARYKASGGVAVVLNSATGGILAMANVAAPKTPTSPPVPAPANWSVTRVYEPGSVMKLTTFSAAITKHLITPNENFVIPNSMMIGGVRFHDAEVHPTEILKPPSIFARSSNIGTIEIAKKVGKKTLLHYQKLFGFGQPTGLHFPGASPGITPNATWSASSIGSVPIGQSNAVNVLQLADAYNVVANGGLFVPPHLVRATVSSTGKVKAVPLPKVHRIIPLSTVKTLLPFMERVVTSKNGTGVKAAIPNYVVAGKTGTARQPYPNKPGYQPGNYVATFAGIAPAQHPAFTIVVSLFHPRVIYGGSVSAPAFAKIMNYTLQHFNVAPPSVPPTSFTPSRSSKGAKILGLDNYLKLSLSPKATRLLSREIAQSRD